MFIYNADGTLIDQSANIIYLDLGFWHQKYGNWKTPKIFIVRNKAVRKLGVISHLQLNNLVAVRISCDLLYVLSCVGLVKNNAH